MYGFPAFSDDLKREIDAGKIVLGGCIVFDDAPHWRCCKCEREWGTFGNSRELESD